VLADAPAALIENLREALDIQCLWGLLRVSLEDGFWARVCCASGVR
jgi:hypothetical protein